MRNFVWLLSCIMGGFILFFLLGIIYKQHVFAEVMMYFGGMAVGLVGGFALGINVRIFK